MAWHPSAVAGISCCGWGCVVSARAVEWARGLRVVGPPTDRALLVRMAELADQTGCGRVGREALAEAVAPRQRLADSYLGRLERRGLVTLHEYRGDDMIMFELPVGGGVS